jgi:hypothetical protein
MPTGLSDRAAAKLAGCTHRAIGEAKKFGRLAKLADGSVSAEAVKKWNADRGPSRGGYKAPVSDAVSKVQEISVRTGETSAAAVERIMAAAGIPLHDRAEADRIKANYEALLRQLEYDTKSGLVVAVSEVAALVGAEYAQIRAKLLAIPAEQAPRLHRLKTVVEIQDALMSMIVEAMEGLIQDRKEMI